MLTVRAAVALPGPVLKDADEGGTLGDGGTGGGGLDEAERMTTAHARRPRIPGTRRMPRALNPRSSAKLDFFVGKSPPSHPEQPEATARRAKMKAHPVLPSLADSL